MTSPPPVAPSPIQAYLDSLHRAFSGLGHGEVATYIPELAKVAPDGFGIVLATVDGQVYEVGDARRQFSIQSVSKPFVYGVALEDRGRARVEQAIGMEPTGDPFNAISLEPGTGRPLNPMINAGAIAAASLVAGDTDEDRLARVLGALSAFAGRPLEVDQAIFESERDTGHRNRAIGHMLRNYGIVDGDPEPALGLYFRQCAVRVDCRDLALMAATLANGGLNPSTGERAVRSEFIEPMLSLMTTCGMYDFSGAWVYNVGLPAKSGVGGGIIAVLPGQLGIGVYSPRLDERGNSARGVAVCQRISADLGLHFLQPPRPSVATVRARYTLQSVRSKRRRTAVEGRLLDALGQQVEVFELQGDLRFATLEPVLRAIVAGTMLITVLDFKRVGHVDGGAARMLAGLASRCAALGQQLLLSRVRRGELLAGLDGMLAPQAIPVVSFQPSLDAALEWCERRLLARPAGDGAATTVLPLAANRLCRGLSADEVAQLQAQLRYSQHESGSLIVQRGDPADALYLLAAGEVSVVVGLVGGGHKRLSTLTAGMVFGEAALIAGGQRSADVRADTAAECWALSAEVFERLKLEQPGLAITLLHNLLASAGETIGRLTAEVAALEG
jgi:glutaminase